jgi:pyruvate/2-oxoglutarate dehydrogenase complex dihydrolipoamide acyltransferase (E2) component
MKTLPLLALATTLFTLPCPAPAAEDAKAAKPKAPPAEKKDPATTEPAAEKPAAEAKLSKEQSALQKALENHGRLKGFHVEVTLKTPQGPATLSGALGAGSLSLDCTDVKGVKKKRIVTGGVFYLSDDGGKTWKKDDAAEKETTLLFNNIITAPIQLAEELVKSDYTSKEEKLNGEDVLHLEKPAKGSEAAVHIWLCREPEMKNMTFLRKVDMIVSGTDLELPATIVYSKLTEPVKITAPAAE